MSRCCPSSFGLRAIAACGSSMDLLNGSFGTAVELRVFKGCAPRPRNFGARLSKCKGREFHKMTTKTLRFTASWIIDYGTSNYGDPESSGMSVKDMIDLISNLQTLIDFFKELSTEDWANLIEWIVTILSLFS